LHADRQAVVAPVDPIVSGPAQVELDPPTTPTDRAELEIYLRVWRVLYPDAEVELAS
jgi:hypothetical protein